MLEQSIDKYEAEVRREAIKANNVWGMTPHDAMEYARGVVKRRQREKLDIGKPEKRGGPIEANPELKRNVS